MELNYPLKSNGMYILNKTQIDDIAAKIHKEHMPHVLESTLPVDIDAFATDSLFLDVQSKTLGYTDSVLGVTAFGDEVVPCLDDMYRPTKMKVSEGMVLIHSSLNINAFYNNLQEDGMHKNGGKLSPGSIHTFHRVLSAVLCRAVKWGYIAANPAARVDLPSIANRKAAYLDEPDARRLLELLHNEPIRWRAMITLDLLSGLRCGELLGLRWCDINTEAQTITISQTSNYLPNRGVYVDTPKTSTSNQPLRLSKSAFALLTEYKAWQDKQRVRQNY